MTPRAFAEAAGVTYKTVFNWVNTGKLKSTRNPMNGRIQIADSELARVMSGVAAATSREDPTPVEEEVETEAEEDPPPADANAEVRNTILVTVYETHGKEAYEALSEAWPASPDHILNQTIAFLTRLTGTIDLAKLAAMTRLLPSESLEGLLPMTWVTPLLTASMDPGSSDSPPHDPTLRSKTGTPKKPAPRQPKAKTPAPGPTDPRLVPCGVCGQFGGGHAAGCPRGKRASEVRAASPAAEAQQAQAYADRAARKREGGNDAPLEGWKECMTEGCEYPHRLVTMAGREGYVPGHLESDIRNYNDKQAEATMRSLGAPSAQTFRGASPEVAKPKAKIKPKAKLKGKKK